MIVLYKYADLGQRFHLEYIDMNILEIEYNLEIGGVQNGFTSSQLNDLSNFAHDNRNPAFYMLGDIIPLFDSTVIIDIYHPNAPDTFRLFLFKDDNGDYWPYASLDCLTDVKSLIKSISF